MDSIHGGATEIYLIQLCTYLIAYPNGLAGGPLLSLLPGPSRRLELTGHKMQSISVVFSTLHCEGYTADLRYIAGSLLFWSLKSYPPF